MNLLFFLTPKQDVAFIYEDHTLRQTLEKMDHHGYASIPVLRRDGTYVGTITEGDLLWYIKQTTDLSLEAAEDVPVAGIPRRKNYRAVTVTTGMEGLVAAAIDQNYVPVVDDRKSFIGLIRRKDIVQYFYDKSRAADGRRPERKLEAF